MDNKTLATVEGKAITSAHLDALIATVPDQQRRQFEGKEGRRQLLEELIAQELFYLEGKKEKADETDAFKKMVEDATEKLLKTHMITKFMTAVTIPEEEVEAYYKDNPTQFIAPDSIRASHILVPAEQQAIDILNELKEGKKTFEEAAKEYSTCPSKDVGGDLNYFSKGKMVPGFENAAFTLNINEMTDTPVKTDFGWHIIKVTDRKENETIPFDYVKDQVRSYLLGQKQNRAFLNHVDTLKEKYQVEINLSL